MVGISGRKIESQSHPSRRRHLPFQSVNRELNVWFTSHLFFSFPFEVPYQPFSGLKIHGGRFFTKMDKFYFGNEVQIFKCLKNKVNLRFAGKIGKNEDGGGDDSA